MIEGLLFLLTSLFIFIILAEKLTAYIHYDEHLTVEIHSTVFALILDFIETSGSLKKRKKRKTNHSLIANIFKRSKARINRLLFLYPSKDPDKNALSFGLYSALLSSILCFFSHHFKKFYYSNIIIKNSDHNKSKLLIDATVEITLLDLLISVISYRLKQIRAFFKLKRGVNYDGKQNERNDKGFA